jgi:hypothetical protein
MYAQGMRGVHPVFADRPEPDVAIWRYFDFPKYVALLADGALFFARGDHLGDPLEGSFTKARQIQRQRLLENPPAGRSREDLQEVFRHNEQFDARGPQSVYVNCWHIGDHESMAMWRGYGGGPYGVAIRSTFGVLDRILPNSFSGTGRTEPIYLGRVKYLEYSSETELVPHDNNLYGPFLCKSVAYANEYELRAVFADVPGGFAGGSPLGYLVSVEVAELVHVVVVSPLAPSWFTDVVRTTNERFGFEFPILNSVVASRPIY